MAFSNSNFFVTALIALSVGGVALPAQADPSDDGIDRWVGISNDTGRDIYHLYYAVPGHRYYGRDLLGADVISDGDDASVLFDDGSGRCNYWVKAVGRGGRVISEVAMNVCRTSTWEV